MKTMKSEGYTDPIVYEEGFFINEENEQVFLNNLRKKVESLIEFKKLQVISIPRKKTAHGTKNKLEKSTKSKVKSLMKV